MTIEFDTMREAEQIALRLGTKWRFPVVVQQANRKWVITYGDRYASPGEVERAKKWNNLTPKERRE